MIIERLMKLALLGSEWVLYLLLILSVISFSTMIERTVFFVRRRANTERIRGQVTSLLGSGKVRELEKALEQDRSFESRVVRVALRWLGKGPEALSDAVESELGQIRGELERGTNLLGTLGNNAPFVGLFGTVLGVIIAFHALGDSGGNPNQMGGVMAGIAEALVATGVGLFVALPAVVAYNIIQKKIGDIENDANALVRLVSAYAKGDPGLVEAARSLAADSDSEVESNAAAAPEGDSDRRSEESLREAHDTALEGVS
jgi:biopolymer transport protein ExbB/TolQ